MFHDPNKRETETRTTTLIPLMLSTHNRGQPERKIHLIPCTTQNP